VTKLPLWLSLLVIATPAFSQPSAPPPISARPGQTATGTVISESNGVLRLNVSPCAAQQRIVVFRNPYVKDDAGVARCANGNKPMVQASQK